LEGKACEVTGKLLGIAVFGRGNQQGKKVKLTYITGDYLIGDAVLSEAAHRVKVAGAVVTEKCVQLLEVVPVT
jgi:hypothetical protein